MIRLLLFGLLISCLGCDGASSASVIRINSLLHDDSSKVWMVKSETIDGIENAPENMNFKTVITFYEDFKFAEQPLNTLGNRPPKYGIFEVGDKNLTLRFIYDRKENVFLIEKYSKQEIILTTSENGSGKTKIRLIPLPKL